MNKKYKLTTQQKNIWMIEQLNATSNMNNITGLFEINKKLDVDILEQAINEIIKNNDGIRINIFEEKAQAMQKVEEYEFYGVGKYICGNSQEIDELIDEVAKKRLDVKKGRLYYFAILQDKEKTVVILKLHHLISDAWSSGQIVEQIKEYYAACLNNESLEEKPSYIEYVKKELEYKSSSKVEKDEIFWKKYVRNINAETIFPAVEDHSGTRMEKEIDASLMEKIETYCDENKIKIYSFFLGVVAIYFMKYYLKEKIVIGTPFLNRSKKEQELKMLRYVYCYASNKY